ncbi:lysophospholipid acyltransferase family protein [Phaeocystidibacter luteus]|uniref:1-acyl-sn-glycerol-3-phosphate acyltransferase n=1 Tax=Phaeocystidibacter luteus TaxID=911197 RepID=A0A6N6RH49_9FLAO|nr:lysophospholipid acyltransferase family protein [Phaeocystidibacter luteus]KAB2808659.1 1-acyl-sn-glycerol-3-phosphate acyltransferase [Phaeocystidibacter luteus]
MKKAIISAFGILYHIWYYLVMALVILSIFPFIYATSRKPEDYPKFFKWARVWAKAVLVLMGLRMKVRGAEKIVEGQQYVICANHASELDIMMALAIVPNPFVFIGKKELASLPLFGYFYKRTNVLVDRKSVASKRRAMEMASAKMNTGIGMCIFPEGGIPNNPYLAPFKMGAFKLAVEHQVPILSIAFPDNRRHFPDFTKGGFPGRVRAEVIGVQDTEGMKEEHIMALRDQTFQRIFGALNELR